MKRLWMTAAAFALCMSAADAWAEPSSPLAASPSEHLLVRVATESTSAHHKRHKHAKTTASAKSSHGRSSHGRGRRGHGRHAAAEERVSGSRHHRHGVSSEIHSAAPAPIKVGRHDTLASISRRTGVSVEELARLNHMRRPYHVILGQRIKLPARRYYVVKSGETLYSLARRFGVEASELAEANGLGEKRHLRSGQRLYLPAGAAEAAPIEEAEAPRYRPERSYTTVAPTPYTPPSSQPYVPPSSQPYAPPATAPATPGAPSQGFETVPAPVPPGQTPPRGIVPSGAPPSAVEVAAAGRGKFLWPVQGGQMISGFGPKPDGQKNDGLNISANLGDPVRSAADGEVVYAGDQVPSFGNLVLIKHAGGWVTAYAHMAHIMVKNRDQVTQGQEIGDIGQTGQVATPQLHFEIRYAPSARDKAVPIDPMLVLPQR